MFHDLILAAIALFFLTFGGVLAAVSIYVALADRADYRRHHRRLVQLEAEAERRFEHRSEAGQIHAAVI